MAALKPYCSPEESSDKETHIQATMVHKVSKVQLRVKSRVTATVVEALATSKFLHVLLEALFTDEELGKSCYAKTSRSTKPPLPAEKITLLEGKC